jgi:hypothetical protein
MQFDIGELARRVVCRVAISRGLAVAPGQLPIWEPLAAFTTVAAIVLLGSARGVYARSHWPTSLSSDDADMESLRPRRLLASSATNAFAGGYYGVSGAPRTHHLTSRPQLGDKTFREGASTVLQEIENSRVHDSILV